MRAPSNTSRSTSRVTEWRLAERDRHRLGEPGSHRKLHFGHDSRTPSTRLRAGSRLTPELGTPVQDDGRRGQSLAPERGDEQESLSGAGDHVLVARDARLDSRREERSRYAGFEALAGLDVDRHELLAGRPVEELLSVGAPGRVGAPGA